MNEAQQIFDEILDQMQVDEHFVDEDIKNGLMNEEQQSHWNAYQMGVGSVLDMITEKFGITLHSNCKDD